MKETTAQKIRTGILAMAGTIAFLVMAGEDTPGSPMGDAQFFISKGLAALTLYGCCRLGKKWKRTGLIAPVKDREEGEAW